MIGKAIRKFMLQQYRKAISNAQDWHYYSLPTEMLTDFINRRGLTLEDTDKIEGTTITGALYFDDDKHVSCHTLTSGDYTGALVMKFA